jgi:acyl-CoA synthetase (NDP forming)
MNRYPVFGPLLMFSLGGIFVELFADVIFRLAPVNRNSARQMVRNIKDFKLLNGFRGRPKTDLDEIEKTLVRLSDMVTSHPEIQELDINPLISHEKGLGATVADCRLVLSKAS